MKGFECLVSNIFPIFHVSDFTFVFISRDIRQVLGQESKNEYPLPMLNIRWGNF